MLLGFSMAAPSPLYTNNFLVEQLQLYWDAAISMYHISAQHVPAHVGIPGNEKADALAAEGRSKRSEVGRLRKEKENNKQQKGINRVDSSLVCPLCCFIFPLCQKPNKARNKKPRIEKKESQRIFSRTARKQNT